MNNSFIAGLFFLVFAGTAHCQVNTQDTKPEKLVFYIGAQVINANDTEEKQIIQLWKDYLLAGQYAAEKSPYWSYESVNVPDEYLWAVGVGSFQERDYQTQCKIIGIFKASNEYYCLKSAFSHVDASGEIHLDVIPTVYAKKFDGKFLLVDSATYHKEILEHHKIGSIHYYVHPFHKFDSQKAQMMLADSEKFAKQFGTTPLEIDYFVANTSREITEIWGYEYMDRMYRPGQTGGVAIVSNKIVYAGNNSEYYPHEVFHLYAFNVAKNIPYFWVNEGIATFFAGSSEKSFEWHLQELKDYHKINPKYDYASVYKLTDFDIPNGKHKTDLRYIIGAIIIREIYAKEGIQGIKDALADGNTKEDFYALLKAKLKVTETSFNSFIYQQLSK